MAASFSSLGGENQQANLSYEIFNVILDASTFVDITPTSIKSIKFVTIFPLNGDGSVSIPNVGPSAFGSSAAWLPGSKDIRINADAGASGPGAAFLIKLEGITA